VNDWPYTYQYPYENQHHERRGRQSGFPAELSPYEAAIMREVRLEEEQAADEMEWAALRGITAPDF
jgi:hypothetical protein